MFEFVSSLPHFHRIAWDCATGNGQAAIGLANYFDSVIATDASPEQISNATPHNKVEFRVTKAETSGIPSASVDLITAAQALHWFDTDAFFREARRVAAPEAAIAVWGYGDPVLDTPRLQDILHAYNRGTIEEYWLPERQTLLDGYRNVEFPFDEVEVPSFTLTRECSLAELMGYVGTWSATARHIAEHGRGELERLENDLADAWGDPARKRRVDAPIFLRAGHIRH